MTAFWWSWPSWLVELLSGLLLASVVQFTVDGIVTQALLATVASLIYESFIDVNGFSWIDVLQRSVGIALGLGFWTWVR